MKKSSIGYKVDTGITYIVLIIVAVIFLIPCLWLILASFSKSGDIASFDGIFPSKYSLDSFKTLFTDTTTYNYPKWFLNTLYIAFFSCIIGSFMTLLTAYTMSRFRFHSRRILMKSSLILGMFPSFMGMIAVFIIMSQLNMLNNRWGLILIYSATAPLGYLTQKGFFDTIPLSIDEAAKIDGASNFQTFIRINIPLSMPIIVYTALTSFAFPWSDYILPKLLLIEKDNWTVGVGLMNLGDVEFARFACGSVFIGVPIIILYFCLVRYMVTGLSAGAVKQ